MSREEVASATAGSPAPVRRVAVVGAGLVGGSVAAAARAAGCELVRVYDRDPATRDEARARDLGTEVVDDLDVAVSDVDLVVVAVPAPVVVEVTVDVARRVAPGTFLTDVASLKAEVVEDLERRLVELPGATRPRFVGGHPMAGSERSGPAAADASLFQGATWVLTPTAATDDETVRTVSGFLGRLGARVLALPPARHDELVALVSHLPQLAASTLAALAGEAVERTGEAVLAVAGGGFRDTTRIAASDPDLWLGILRGNRAAVLEALDAYRRRLDELAAALGAGDDPAVRALLERGSAARRRLVPKVADEPMADVVVALDDRPGALGAATTALGEAGINVEDLTMRHADDGTRGALLLRVRRAVGARALAAVHARGFPAHLEEVDP
jgi:prephenate dehydrogenase